MKKVLSIILAVVLVASVLPFSLTASADTSGYYTYSVSNGEATITDVSTYISGSVTIPSNLGGYPVKSIDNYAFDDCTGLTSITIPNSVKSIGYCAFDGCTGLTSITIPDSVTSIGDWAFYGCTGLTSITVPNSVTSIGDGAFSDCTGLTSITVDEGNTAYHSKNNCLIETESKTLISGCKNSIIPTDGSVTSIGGSAFSGCTGLTSITIPNSVKSIGSSAFEGCTGLTSITIGNSVTSIGRYAFYGCTGLEDVWYTGSEEDRNNIAIDWYNDSLLNANWHYNYVPTPEIKYGFVTDDEEISASDALAILQAAVGKVQLTDAQKTAGDVDGDGKISATDALLVLQYSVGKIDKFPVEG